LSRQRITFTTDCGNSTTAETCHGPKYHHFNYYVPLSLFIVLMASAMSIVGICVFECIECSIEARDLNRRLHRYTDTPPAALVIDVNSS
jgi:hypothetical protein